MERRKSNVLYNIPTTYVGVASLIKSNQRLLYDPEVPGREGVNALPEIPFRLSPPTHRFICKIKSHSPPPQPPKAGSPEITVGGTVSS